MKKNIGAQGCYSGVFRRFRCYSESVDIETLGCCLGSEAVLECWNIGLFGGV